MVSFVYITNRYEPKFGWFYESLRRQWPTDLPIPEIIAVAPEHSRISPRPYLRIVRPKPTVWSGPSRLTKVDWWSASNARNTGICYATRPWISFVDDRSVLLPGWVNSLREAMQTESMLAGTYEKVHDLVVEDGLVKSFTSIGCVDSRLEYVDKHLRQHFKGAVIFSAPGEWTFGCALAMPLEWVLEVGGFDETCDGCRGEDCIFGLMLQNRGRKLFFDPRMKMLEDRTPAHSGPSVMAMDKGVSPNDKSHALLAKLRGLNHVLLPRDLRNLRDQIQAGLPFPPALEPTHDWWDSQPLKEMG